MLATVLSQVQDRRVLVRWQYGFSFGWVVERYGLCELSKPPTNRATGWIGCAVAERATR